MRCGFDKKSPIGWMIENSVVANILMILLLLGGLAALFFVKQEVFPDYERDEVQIRVSYPQASPEDIEKAILMPIEEALNSIEGIKRYKGVAKEGSATVYVESFRGYDLTKLQNDIENAIFRIRTFPKEAEKPVITQRTYERTTVSLVIYGPVERIELYRYAKILKYKLLENPQISRVTFYGISPLQIAVEIDSKTLNRYGLNITDVSAKIAKESLDLPAGIVKTESGEIVLKLRQRGERPKEFEDLPVIETPLSKPLALGAVASIKSAFEDEDYFAFYNGLPAIRVEVKNPQSYSPIEISKIVERTIKESKTFLPPSISVETLYSGAKVYEERVKLLLKNAALGLVLVLITLSLFLEPRLAFWVMMGIPVSFLGSVLLFEPMDLSLSMISLFAFIIALGIVVDDAIVVGENIHRYKELGCPPKAAAYIGAKEMAVPISFSILTNIIAFMPILFIPGVTGKIFEAIPLVVTAVFTISWLESLFILPSHLAQLPKIREKDSFQKRFSKSFRWWIRTKFAGFLKLCLRHRYATLTLFLSLFVATLSFALSGRMGMQLFPDTESDYARAFIRFPTGTDVNVTKKGVQILINSALKLKESIPRGDELIRGVYARVGRSGPEYAEVRVYLADPDIRKEIMSTLEFGRKWREATPKIEGAVTVQFFSSASVGAHGTPISVELSHFDEKVLKKAALEVAKALEKYPNVFNIDPGFQKGKKEISFTLKPAAYRLGLDARKIAQEIRGRFYGSEAARIIVESDEVKILAKLPLEERRDLSTFEKGYIVVEGKSVPISSLIETKISTTPAEIIRKDGKRIINVEADIRPRSRALEVLNDLESTTLNELVKKYPGLSYTFEGRQTQIRENVSSLKYGFLFSLIAIYVLLAIPFKSYFQPLIVMSAIPFGIIGAILGHLLMGYSMSLISLFGMIALCGIVINDSLIMLKFANEYKKRFGFSAFKVATQAALSRFRPVFLTTLTTFVGLMPMIFETSRQARFLIPMAISLGFGILFATVITLILVPALYLIGEDIKKGLK